MGQGRIRGKGSGPRGTFPGYLLPFLRLAVRIGCRPVRNVVRSLRPIGRGLPFPRSPLSRPGRGFPILPLRQGPLARTSLLPNRWPPRPPLPSAGEGAFKVPLFRRLFPIFPQNGRCIQPEEMGISAQVGAGIKRAGKRIKLSLLHRHYIRFFDTDAIRHLIHGQASGLPGPSEPVTDILRHPAHLPKRCFIR